MPLSPFIYHLSSFSLSSVFGHITDLQHLTILGLVHWWEQYYKLVNRGGIWFCFLNKYEIIFLSFVFQIIEFEQQDVLDKKSFSFFFIFLLCSSIVLFFFSLYNAEKKINPRAIYLWWFIIRIINKDFIFCSGQNFLFILISRHSFSNIFIIF